MPKTAWSAGDRLSQHAEYFIAFGDEVLADVLWKAERLVHITRYQNDFIEGGWRAQEVEIIANEWPSGFPRVAPATLYAIEDRTITKYLLHIMVVKQERPVHSMYGTFQGPGSVIHQIPGISSLKIEGRVFPAKFTGAEKFICDVRGIDLRGRIESTEYI